MPESLVQVTEGVGKKLHTFQRIIGANTVEDEVVVNGEPYLASYKVSVAVSAATANSHLLQIMAGATLKVRIRRIELHLSSLATTAALMDTRIIRLTTAGTGGTAQTPAVLDPADSASGATAMTLPTVKGTEGTTIEFLSPAMTQTLSATPPLVQPILAVDYDRPRSKPLIIAAGVTNGICIKNVTAIAAGGVIVTVWLDESNF
jgi:hypothetical protein